jgi:2-polyprenyl-3-methyl-5-hydroxy-6-metoxy-1,4-benzoquinol methylase
VEIQKSPANWYFQSIKVDVLQRLWHKRRFTEVTRFIEPVSGLVLDVGCNDGTFSQVVFEKTKAKKLVGIDIDTKPITWAKKHWSASEMSFSVGDAHHLKFKTGLFDAVFCLEALEHVKDPAQVLGELKRVLKKGGYGIFLVPTDSILFRLIWFIWLHFYPRGWVWRETHIQTYRNNYLPEICRRVGFKIEKEKKFNLGMLHLVKVRKAS